MVPNIAIINNSIKYSFVYRQLNDETVLVFIIQFSMSPLFAHSLNVKHVLFDPQIGPYQVLPFWITVDQEAMAIKGESTYAKAPALLEPHHLIACVIL